MSVTDICAPQPGENARIFIFSWLSKTNMVTFCTAVQIKVFKKVKKLASKKKVWELKAISRMSALTEKQVWGYSLQS